MSDKAPTKAFLHLRFWQAALLIAILAVGFLGIWWAVQRADHEMRQELLTQTRLVAQAVNLHQVEALTGSERDLALPVYQDLKAQMVRVKQANSKCRFVYLLGRKPDGKLFFLVDSEPVGSKDYSPPGQVYDEATEELQRVFADRVEFAEGPTPDRWGLWVSGLVPLIDPHTGEMPAVLGMDINAYAWNWEVAARAALPVGLILALLIIMAALLAAGRRADSSPRLVLRRLLLPIALLLILLMVVSGFLLWQQQKQRLAENIHREISEVSVELRLTLDQQASGLAAVLRLIAADPAVQQALRQGKADSLAAKWRPVFDILKRENHVTHFSFLDASRFCLVSLCGPDECGSRITRVTAAQAQETGRTVSGLELDSDGALTLWVMQPVFDRGVLVGYVELGKEIEDALSALHARSGVQLATTINKKHLKRHNWEEGRRRRGQEPDWDRLAQRVVGYASQGRLPDVLARPDDHDGAGEQGFGKMDKEITFEGKTWQVAASPLQDASGREVGDLLVMFDITAQTEAYARFLGLVGASGGVILVFLLSFVFVLLRHTDQGIRAQTAELRRSEEKYRLLFENAPLGIMHYDQDGTITDLNEAFAAIIGAPKERILGFNMPQQLRNDQMRQALMASLSGRPGYFEGEYLSVIGGRATQVRAFFRSVFSETGSFQGGVSIFEDYTERFQAEQNRQEYLNFLQILLDAIPNPVFYKDTGGIFLGCNKACEAAWGRSQADLVGKSVAQVHSPELAKLHEAKDQELFNHPGMLVYEITKVAADGSRKNFIIHKATFFKGDGSLGGLIGVEVDITARQQAEEALKLNEQRLGALLKLNQMTEATVQDITHFALEEAVRLTGSQIGYIAFVNREETVLTMHAWSINAMAECRMEDKPLVYPLRETGLWGEAVRQRRPILTNDFAAANPLKRGYPEGHIPVSRHLNVPIIDDNRIVIVAGVGNKPTDYDRSDVRQLTLLMEGLWRIVRRQETADELEQSLSLLKATLESTADGLLVIDRAGNIVAYNQKFAQMWRIPEALLASGDDRQALAYALKQLKDPEGFLSKVHLLYDQPELESDDLIEFADGRVFERYSQPQKIGPNILGRVWSFRDITEKRHMEHQLLQAQKMEAVGRLAGGVAHDFNNLLSAIMGYSEILLLDLGSQDPLCGLLQEILQAAQRGEALTRQLLAFSRKQILQPQVINLNTVIADMKKMLGRLIGEDIDLKTILAEDLGAVQVDPGQMEQVIMNLAVNARDAMPLGGRLTIETTNVFFDEHYSARHLELNPGPAVMLAVSDNGEGMDPATQAHIFEPFFTTKDQGKGTGLGLATVYGIVKQSGGLINLYSEPGQGACFKIYFPRAEGPLDVAPTKEVSAEQVAGWEKVLVVEDDEALRSLIKRALEKYGYGVLAACHGREACSLVEQHQGAIQLMITDVVMPGMSGSKLADQLKPLQPDMKVLYMSGYTENAIVHHGILDKEINFLQKPFKIMNLLQKVRYAIDASPPSR